MNDSTGAAKVAELMKDIRFAMLTTLDDTGTPMSRPMATQEVEFDGDLWFFATRDSRKVAQIRANPVVNVALTSADTWVSLTGRAQVVTDRAKAKELWNSAVQAWFPGGPEDDNVILLKIDGDSAEYWDSPGGRIATVLSLVKAKVTGAPYDGGENETVAL